MKLLFVTLSLITLGVGSPAPKYFLIETDGDILKEDSNVLGEAADQDYHHGTILGGRGVRKTS